MSDLSPNYSLDHMGNLLLITIAHHGKRSRVGLWIITWIGSAFLLWRWGNSALFTQDLFFPFALFSWLIGGFLTIFLMVWRFWGVEIVEVNSLMLRVNRSIWGIGFTQIYNVSQIHDMQLALQIEHKTKSDYLALLLGQIAFGYGTQKIHFGVGLPEQDSQEIVEQIQRYYPYFLS
ncbi:MAG: hypothetical protein GY943_22830 [Chloroflexi bacterium]|nr:hypothetical protein [Chloroflexota bacterium]